MGGFASLSKLIPPLLERKSHCEERSDEANQKIKMRLLRLRLAMTRQPGGEIDTGGQARSEAGMKYSDIIRLAMTHQAEGERDKGGEVTISHEVRRKAGC